MTTESYTLDAEGNRVASHRSSFHVLAPANRLIEDEQFVYEYNPDGNLIRKSIKADGKEWRYGYDIYDRLTSAGLYAGAGKHFSLRAAAPPTRARLHAREAQNLRGSLPRTPARRAGK